jgi:DNA-binding LacI/PurR family transcriptional regulator
MRVTIRDIAQNLSLSHTTVSRVLNGRGETFISVWGTSRIMPHGR